MGLLCDEKVALETPLGWFKFSDNYESLVYKISVCYFVWIGSKFIKFLFIVPTLFSSILLPKIIDYLFVAFEPVASDY